MTVLIFNSGRYTLATETWTVMEYHSHAVTKKSAIAIHVLQMMANPVNIDLSMDEFITMVAEGGKIIDLRSFQR